MAPEYAIDGLFSIKSDVFSFGIVILEIISGRRNTGFFHQEEASNLLGLVSKSLLKFLLSFFNIVTEFHL